MPKAKANNIEIEYETFGDPSSKPLLLVMGLGAQMIAWLDDFCMKFVDKGFYVIRFDNRDIGLSTKFEEAGIPDLMKEVMALQRGETITPAYILEDMADDAVGLLDALNIEKAHICGASMGGMIVQIIAFRHPTRVLSLTSIMSTTGNPDLPQAKPEAMQVLLAPAPTEREAFIEESVRRRRILYGSGFPYDVDRQREIAAITYDRSFYPQGMARQTVAILANGNRASKLGSIKVPTLVIHGGDDPLVPVEGGKETAEKIDGADLILIDGMGHSLPPETWPQIVDAIAKNADKVNN
ncbi:MAG: alpha/beta hydrolase [Candidatus Lokiarchaeota archaeon]|nr:alpha/beta hydrolase [Candidatus Lokiarchaeota archaeon]